MDKKLIKTYKHPMMNSYPWPSDVKDKHIGSRLLIVGSGPSSGELLKYKHKLREKFDVIMALNFAIKDFQDYADYHMVLENKPTRLAVWTMANVHNKKLTYILNKKSVRFFKPSLKIIRADRSNCDDNPDIKNYTSGLFDGFSDIRVGTSVIVQALHMAGIWGCSSIHMAGVELFFDKTRYYYENEQSISHKPPNRLNSPDLKLERVEFGGKEFWSLPVYYKSAESVNRLIVDQFSKHNISVNDFSNGLITEANQVDVHEFFKK